MTIRCIDSSEYPALLTNGQIYYNANLVGPFYFFTDNSGTKGAFRKDFFIEEVGIVTAFVNSPAVNNFNNN